MLKSIQSSIELFSETLTKNGDLFIKEEIDDSKALWIF